MQWRRRFSRFATYTTHRPPIHNWQGTYRASAGRGMALRGDLVEALLDMPLSARRKADLLEESGVIDVAS